MQRFALALLRRKALTGAATPFELGRSSRSHRTPVWCVRHLPRRWLPCQVGERAGPSPIVTTLNNLFPYPLPVHAAKSRDDGSDQASGSMWRRFVAPTPNSIVSFPPCFADSTGSVAVNTVVKIRRLNIPAKAGKLIIADGASVTFSGALLPRWLARTRF